MEDSAISWMHPDELHESGINPRSIDAGQLDALKTAISAAPEMLVARPIMATVEGEIVGGNMRHRAIQQMLRTPGGEYVKFIGWVREHGGIPVYIRNFTEKEKLEWMLRDNNSYGTYVNDELAALLNHYDADLEGDFGLLGFRKDELDALLRGDDADTGEADVDPPDTPVWGVIVECDNETDQTQLLEELDGRDYKVRSIL